MNMILTITAALIFTIVILLHVCLTSNFDYWKKRRIFYQKPTPLFGNFFKVASGQECLGIFLKNLSEAVEKPFFGVFIFRTPVLLINDINLAKHILVKDFESFHDRALHHNKNDQISCNMLPFMKLNDWKVMRQKLSSFFSPGKLKTIVNLQVEVADKMIEYIHGKSGILDAKAISLNYMIDLISKSAFGIDSNCCLNENAEFKKMGIQLLEFKLMTALRFILYLSVPAFVEFFKVSLFNPKACNFFKRVFNESTNAREKMLTVGNNLIDLIMELKENDEFRKKHQFHENEIVSQAVLFIIAGSETGSCLVSFSLYELSVHPEIQTKLRQEMQRILAKHGGITYDSLQEMDYLDMVVSETLRKYPPAPFIDRICTQEYKIPDTDTVIEKGTRIMISNMAMHYNEEYFPNPNDFIPERFADRNELFFANMPFGQGPRKCVGYRFALMNTKVALTKILLNFEVLKTEHTPIPIEFQTIGVALTSKNGFPLRFKKL